MKIEVEITKKEKQIVELETPAYFFGNYRQIKITENEIIEVNNNICIIRRANDPYCGFEDSLIRNIKFEPSSMQAYDNELNSFIISITNP